MNVLEAGKLLLKEYHKRGYEAYIVGGCVRNLLLQLPVHDVDICTNAKPEETLAMFDQVYQTGIRFGTVTVCWHGHLFEVTTFRIEEYGRQGRNPTIVQYTSHLIEDLRRRDFTMNAIAMDQEGNLFDPFNGRTDIQEGRIRSVGDAVERFREDGLRLLRAVRFAAQLGFEIEETTWQAMIQERSCLRQVALERIVQEVEKILLAPDKDKGILLIHRARLIFQLKSEEDIVCFRATNDLDVLWTLLFQLTLPDNGISFTWQELPLSRKLKERIHWLMERYLHHPNATVEDYVILTRNMPQDWVEKALQFQWIMNGERDTWEKQVEEFNRQVEALPIKSIRELAIRGDEIATSLGIPRGPWIKEILNDLWEGVNFHDLPNRKAELIHYLVMQKERWFSEGSNP
jgi:tRNA nucleotidyltransferase (CCA-adding enzyme)